MFFDFDSYCYYVRPGFTDARTSFRTLSCIVDEEMGLDPRGKAMFIFCNKAKNTLKILVWDDGYWVLSKRLERGTFAWPDNNDEAMSITKDDIRRIIQGEDIFRRLPRMPRKTIY